ncbi:MAG: adenine deaminase [Desulfobacteraceae bacterium]|nr:MAG: adenine deaminase [Desulfobacteraceae bacterium]
MELKERIAVGSGKIPADLVLKGGKILNVFTGEVLSGDVAVYGGVIAGVGPSYKGREEVDTKGKWIAPGLIDAHFHIESSMLVPSALASAVMVHGTTALVADPHEIANVMGLEGIRFMLDESMSAPVDIFFTAPSCVPATHLETSGAKLSAADLAEFASEPRILGLAEMMNFSGVINGIDQVLEKVVLFQGRVIDGHAPFLTGQNLQGYLSAGIGSDHECVGSDEALEKLRSGAYVMIREGTSAKNLETLLPLVNEKNSRRFCLVSDDLHAEDLLLRGHLDFTIGKAIRLGISPVVAVQMATLNPAEYFGLKNRGAIAPGYIADMVILDDLGKFQVNSVYKGGRLIADKGKAVNYETSKANHVVHPFLCGELTLERLAVVHQGGKARVIETVPDQILTKISIMDLPFKDGLAISDIESDVIKICVLERHLGTGNVGIGFVKGFGFKRGALASSVAHDSHNIIAAGVTDSEIAIAVGAVRDMNGGISVVDGEKVIGRLPLPVAGLMSDKPLEILVGEIKNVKSACRNLGCGLEDPLMTISFLALPVIPALKLTDLGLVDVNNFKIVPLFIKG